MVHHFDAAVWGTVAAWVGAGGTASAALVAARIYGRDSRASAQVQARQVIFRADRDAPEVSILNTSDLPVFDVRVSWDVDYSRFRRGALTAGARERLVTPIEDDSQRWEVLRPGAEEKALNIAAQPMGAAVTLTPRLVLQDVRGNEWTIPPLGDYRKLKRSRVKRYWVRRFRVELNWMELSHAFGRRDDDGTE